MPTDKQKKFRDRANRARRALIQEKKKFGFISDGSGKRYRVSIDFFLSGDLEKAEDFIRWFNEQYNALRRPVVAKVVRQVERVTAVPRGRSFIAHLVRTLLPVLSKAGMFVPNPLRPHTRKRRVWWSAKKE